MSLSAEGGGALSTTKIWAPPSSGYGAAVWEKWPWLADEDLAFHEPQEIGPDLDKVEVMRGDTPMVRILVFRRSSRRATSRIVRSVRPRDPGRVGPGRGVDLTDAVPVTSWPPSYAPLTLARWLATVSVTVFCPTAPRLAAAVHSLDLSSGSSSFSAASVSAAISWEARVSDSLGHAPTARSPRSVTARILYTPDHMSARPDHLSAEVQQRVARVLELTDTAELVGLQTAQALGPSPS